MYVSPDAIGAESSEEAGSLLAGDADGDGLDNDTPDESPESDTDLVVSDD